MMRIGIISDTHIPEIARDLPQRISQVFRGVDLILHAGDIYVVSVLDQLEALAPVLAAEGDDDYLEVNRDHRVTKRQELQVEGLKLWLCHERLVYGPFAWPRAAGPASPKPDSPDILVFGHTHQARVDQRDGTLLVNPGSATFPHYVKKPGTVALLTVDAGQADAQIIPLE